MHVEETITKYYINKSKEDQKALAELLANILGHRHLGLIEKRMQSSIFSFVISEDDIEYSRANSNLNKTEEQLLDYFEDKACDTDSGEYTIGICNPHNINCDCYVNNPNSSMGIIKNKNIIYTYTKINLFSTKKLNDRLYICTQLLGLSFHMNNSKFESYYDDIDLDMDSSLIKQSYIYFINMLSYKISKDFHSKGYYIFDEENMVSKIEKDEEDIFNVWMNKRFYDEFNSLLPMFFYNPNKFINMIGKENYIDYIKYYIERDESVDIDEVIERMIQNKNNNGNYRISIDMDKLLNLKRYMNIEKKNDNGAIDK